MGGIYWSHPVCHTGGSGQHVPFATGTLERHSIDRLDQGQAWIDWSRGLQVRWSIAQGCSGIHIHQEWSESQLAKKHINEKKKRGKHKKVVAWWIRQLRVGDTQLSFGALVTSLTCNSSCTYRYSRLSGLLTSGLEDSLFVPVLLVSFEICWFVLCLQLCKKFSIRIFWWIRNMVLGRCVPGLLGQLH
jgi:hypothetical protein